MIYFAVDHNGFELKNYLIKECKKNNLEIVDLSPSHDPNDDYPLVAKTLAEKLKNDPNGFGVAICGSGQGVAMALNRFNWVRAGAKIVEKETAKNIRKHNHANCITFGAWDLSHEKAFELLKIFLETNPDLADRHQRRVKQMYL